MMAAPEGRCGPRAMLLLGAALLGGCGDARTTFDKAGWAAEHGNYDGRNRRATMVSSLDEAGIVSGATRERVRGLLGEPDATGPADDIYFLGRSTIGPSFETYRIDYGADGRVTGAAIRRD